MRSFRLKLRFWRRGKPILKEPRKKVELNLEKAHEKFISLSKRLEKIMSEESEANACESQILSEVSFLEDTQVYEAVLGRVQKVPYPLLNENDLGVWLLDYYTSLIAKIEALLELEEDI